ncbi:hypothetical protein CHRY9390_00998 [Chryseobacterium aquaeductus]|uniref:Uncharacterized protein n=1 Tax=Chryseobacterium aquaeductus TaxID=2675056 RepID=A0A9N8MGM3_9FLAO|nr:hypothetical protein [Chryseobacterium aquaeductus]CAA7330336.1 hypothetical protein CHRY9390_00998 [Chryseobacterium potabilaquae]CAD7802923.1 hypothetical protein CHRY9390_00998 [Chryseobacterium aquaeductus]
MKYTNVNFRIRMRFIQVLCILIAGLIYSQDYPLKFGIKAGWNYSNVNAIDEFGEKSGYLSGIIDEAYGGFVIEKQISTKSYIQAAPTITFMDGVIFIELPVYFK